MVSSLPSDISCTSWKSSGLHDSMLCLCKALCITTRDLSWLVSNILLYRFPWVFSMLTRIIQRSAICWLYTGREGETGERGDETHRGASSLTGVLGGVRGSIILPRSLAVTGSAGHRAAMSPSSISQLLQEPDGDTRSPFIFGLNTSEPNNNELNLLVSFLRIRGEFGQESAGGSMVRDIL